SLVNDRDENCCIVGLAVVREFVERAEGGVDDSVRSLPTIGSDNGEKAMWSPLFSGCICCLDQAVCVCDDQITGVELDHSERVVGIRKKSYGWAARLEPCDGIIWMYHHRRIVACVHVLEAASVLVENTVKQGRVPIREGRRVQLTIHRCDDSAGVVW